MVEDGQVYCRQEWERHKKQILFAVWREQQKAKSVPLVVPEEDLPQEVEAGEGPHSKQIEGIVRFPEKLAKRMERSCDRQLWFGGGGLHRNIEVLKHLNDFNKLVLLYILY